jgi:hypothetical protein
MRHKTTQRKLDEDTYDVEPKYLDEAHKFMSGKDYAEKVKKVMAVMQGKDIIDRGD